MRLVSLTAALATLTGCAGPLARHQHEYDALVRDLRRADRARGAADDDAFLDAATLDRDALIAAVLARNPDAEAARQAWRAAVAEVSAAGALDDPTLTYEIAPLSVAGDAPFGQRVALRQMLPFPGKRGLAALAALAEAEAARGDHDAMRAELAEMAASLFADYYVTARALEVNVHHRALIERMKQSAEAQLSVGRAAEQDSLAAEVELGLLDRERIMLETARVAAVAELNGLLHRDPDAALPPAPAALPYPAEPAPADVLARDALADRPQLAAARAEVRATEAERAMARRERYPDLELMTSYDSMAEMAEHRWMIGVGISLPLERRARRARIEVEDARVARSAAEVDALGDRIRVEVTRARRELVEGFEIARLYDDRLLPAALDEVDAALAGYTAGQNDFGTVLSAERDLRDVELEVHRMRAELWRRAARLDRVSGHVPGGAS